MSLNAACVSAVVMVVDILCLTQASPPRPLVQVPAMEVRNGMLGTPAWRDGGMRREGGKGEIIGEGEKEREVRS